MPSSKSSLKALSYPVLQIVPYDDPQVGRIEDGLDAYNAAFGVHADAYEQFACIATSADGGFLGGYKAKIFAGGSN